jgi:hypothetical protein
MMPRDFVPCEYRECFLASRLIDRGAFSCDVIELFALQQVKSRGSDPVMSLDSHQFTSREPCAVAPDGVPDVLHFDIQNRLRGPLFAYFYATMADLE